MRTIVRAGGVNIVVGALVAAPLLGLGLASFVLATEPGRSFWSTAVCRAVGVLAIVAAVVFTKRLARPGPPLRMNVTSDTIRFRQSGRPEARFWREDIEMIVIERSAETGSYALSMYGPERSVLDGWQTGWLGKPNQRVIKDLVLHGYPHTFRHAMPRPRPPADRDWSLGDRRRVRTRPRHPAIKGPRRPGTAAP